jgi:hypothetical protein
VIRPIVTVTLVAAAFTLVAGCRKPTAATTASAAPSASEAPPPAPVATGLATSEDFEQAANDQINPQNMEQELEKLEKDIGP